MSLPQWMLNRRITDDNELILYNVQLCKALSIAHQALETLKSSVTGDCYLGQEKEIAIVDEALRRIASLGDTEPEYTVEQVASHKYKIEKIKKTGDTQQGEEK